MLCIRRMAPSRALTGPVQRIVGPRLVRYASTPGGGPKEVSNPTDPKTARDLHVQELRKYYPAPLVSSILAAEASVTPEMMANLKEDVNGVEFAPIYNDDFAKYDKLFDYARHDWVDRSKPLQPIPSMIPPGVSLKLDEYTGRNLSGVNITKLEQLTGLSADFIKSLTMREITRKRVVNMTRKGKMPSFYSLAIVGDRNGHVGIGEGKNASQPSKALAQAHWNAIKNLVYIPRFEERTIYGNIDHKYHAVLLQLRSAPPGSGLRVNHVIYEICKCVGIKDLVGNVGRSRNPMNVAKGAIEALAGKQILINDIAASRGKKVVDVTNAYYNF